ncbi:MAG: hypothetical protein QOF51_214 [Chloroflexota bacterium]|nr:hypothetical protein [Chloroflexota bacterium]
MGPEERNPADQEIPGAMPERWETAIEDAAQLVALSLDRAQDVADIINDFAHARPVLFKAVLAATVGAFIGAVLAGRGRRRHRVDISSVSKGIRESARSSARELRDSARSSAKDLGASAQDLSSTARERGASVLEQAVAIAQAAAERMSERAPSRGDILDRIPKRAPVDTDKLVERGRKAVKNRRSEGMPDASQLRYAAQLVPIAFALLRNPMIRDLITRSATSRVRRFRDA